MADLGDLSELEIWHDGKGFGAGWHLDFVEVHSSATGKVGRRAPGRAQGAAPPPQFVPVLLLVAFSRTGHPAVGLMACCSRHTPLSRLL